MTRLSIAPTPRLFAATALACFLIALLGFGAALPGYSHAMHPVALLGARGVPHWIGFDALGFVVPGLLAWWAHVRAGWQWQVGAVPMGRVAAIGWTMCTIAALAFAAQGLLAVDVTRGFGFGVGRLHTAMYMVWWIAFVAGAVLLAAGAGPTTAPAPCAHRHLAGRDRRAGLRVVRHRAGCAGAGAENRVRHVAGMAGGDRAGDCSAATRSATSGLKAFEWDVAQHARPREQAGPDRACGERVAWGSSVASTSVVSRSSCPAMRCSDGMDADKCCNNAINASICASV
jgi:hypothetical protein